MDNGKIGGKETFAFVSYSFGQTVSMCYVLALLSIFYTDVAGIPPSTVAAIYLAARLWDAVNDPLMGIIIDKVRLKGGRFKPWLNFSVWLLPVATVALFLNFDLPGTFKVVYAAVTYILWGMIYTVSDVPAFALPTIMTDSVTERNALISKRVFGSAIGAVIVIPATALVEKIGWLPLAAIYSAVLFLTMLPIRRRVEERIEYKRGRNMSLREIFIYLRSNKYLLVFYISYLVLNATNTGAAMGSYFAKYNLGNLGLASVISAVAAGPLLIVPLLLPALVKRFGKKKIMLTGMGTGIVIGIILYFCGYSNFGLFLALTTLKGICMCFPLMMLGMITSDCVEYGHYVTGNRAEGLSFSIQTFTAKLAGAISGAVSLFLLDFYGYKENAVQSASTLDGIWISSTLLPLAGNLLMFLIILFFYNLKEDDVQMMILHNKKEPVHE